MGGMGSVRSLVSNEYLTLAESGRNVHSQSGGMYVFPLSSFVSLFPLIVFGNDHHMNFHSRF